MAIGRETAVYFVLGWIIGFSMMFCSLQLRCWPLQNPENAQKPVRESSSQLIFLENKKGDEMEEDIWFDETYPNFDQVAPTTDFKDGQLNVDDTAVADELSRKLRILCLVFTHQKNHLTKAANVNATWGQRCTKLLFVTNQNVPSLPTLIVNVSDGRQFLSEKTRQAFNNASNYADDFDWFLKADDDTYVVMENLRYFLSAQDPKEALYFGQIFLRHTKQGYTSGGAGYVISRESMRRFREKGKEVCGFATEAEDVDFGRCMALLKIPLRESLDSLGRTRFHCLSSKSHASGNLPKWFSERDKYRGEKKGISSMSDYAISFHYLPAEGMLLFEYLIYHLSPYGIIKGLQDLNVHNAIISKDYM